MKKKINIPLIVATIAIWAIIVYTIAEAVWFNSDDLKIKSEAIEYNFDENKANIEHSEFEFEYLEKDPFKSTQRRKLVETEPIILSAKKVIIKEETPISFTVGGVVINGNSKNIVFNDQTNSHIIFLKEGDSYMGLRVLKVTKNQVEFLDTNTGNKLISQIQ